MPYFDELKKEADLQQEKLEKIQDFKKRETELYNKMEKLEEDVRESPIVNNKIEKLYKDSIVELKDYFKNKGFNVKEENNLDFSIIHVTYKDITMQFTTRDNNCSISMEIKSRGVYDTIYIQPSDSSSCVTKLVINIYEDDSSDSANEKLKKIEDNIEILEEYLRNIENVNIILTLYERNDREFTNITDLLNAM